MGHLEVWKIKLLAINKKDQLVQILFLMNGHAYLKRVYLIIEEENNPKMFKEIASSLKSCRIEGMYNGLSLIHI